MSITSDQKELLLNTFPNRENTNSFIVARLFEVRFAEKINKVYTRVQLEDTDEDEVAVDASGYTGNLHRERPDEKLLKPITMAHLIRII